MAEQNSEYPDSRNTHQPEPGPPETLQPGPPQDALAPPAAGRSFADNTSTITTIILVMAIVTPLALAVLVALHRFNFYQSHRSLDIALALAVGAVFTAALMVAQHRAVTRRGQTLKAIEASLTDFQNRAHTDDVLKTLTPFAAGFRITAAGRGWNALLATLEQLQDARQTSALDAGAGQLLCTYDAQRLLGLLHSLPDGIVLTDPAGAVVLANRACEGLIGRPLNNILGRSVLELFDDPAAREHLQNVLAHAGADDFFEIAADTSPDNLDPQPSESTTLRVYCQRLNAERQDTALLITLRDVTQQKLRESGQEHFINHVSHEFRSPLTNIRAYTETLLSDMTLDAQTQKDAFNVINDETNRLIRLVNDVLDLSRMETGSLSLDQGEVVLDRLIRQCVNDVKASATAKNITLQTNYHPKMPNLHADREKLAVVINNILSNAIKYTPDAGTVFVETNVDDRSVYIKIADTGYGIAPEDLNKVFTRFYRVDRQETANIPGTGLGLATCKELVMLHRGAINVASELNKGTEMVIKLPLTTTGPVLGPARTQPDNTGNKT